jgi:hypothetical protein
LNIKKIEPFWVGVVGPQSFLEKNCTGLHKSNWVSAIGCVATPGTTEKFPKPHRFKRKLNLSTRIRRHQMSEEQTIPMAQYISLQALVGELLLTNQKLREQLAQLAQSLQLTATATHPQPRLDH